MILFDYFHNHSLLYRLFLILKVLSDLLLKKKLIKKFGTKNLTYYQENGKTEVPLALSSILRSEE